MASAVSELETGLQAMLGLKPPGVSGSRIGAITSLCVANVQSESVLIQKIYTHFKKAPGTHKLGVLYVVDSVTRKWLDQAKQQGQMINGSAQDGTYAAGVHRVTELMPILMNDITSSAPADQKDKLRKLVDIWEKGQTFPPQMLASFKDKVNAPVSNQSTTPPGSPPQNSMPPTGSKPTPPTVPSNIMEALANIARQNTSAHSNTPPAPTAHPAPPIPAAAPYSAPMPSSSSTVPSAGVNMPLAGLPYQTTPQAAPQPIAQPPPPVNQPAFPYAMPPAQNAQPPPQNMSPMPNGQSNPYMGNAGPSPLAGGADPKVQQQLQLVQTLLAQGIPVDKITAIVSQIMGGGAGAGGVPPAAPALTPAPQMPQPSHSSYQQGPMSWEPSRPDDSRDRGYYGNGSHGRSRSRSPGRDWDQRDSPRGRADDRFDSVYGRRSPPGRGRGRGSDYRQRSPVGRRGGSPGSDIPDGYQRWVDYDQAVPSNHIKVYSRTLFVGGVTCSEHELRGVFSRYGGVQTCIVNKDKRHAFVKMFTRRDAVAAKEGMEEARQQDHQLRTRWGVGYGPRDCSDYSTGVSVIPIHRLTDADRKWMLTAPYGGSGGRPIESGLSVEEPDIEIGAGVSSKAISRRMQTDKGGSHGPKSSQHRRDDDVNGFRERHRGGGGGGGRGGRGGRESRGREDEPPSERGANDASGPFPFGITTDANGMPVYPPGFMFPAPNSS